MTKANEALPQPGDGDVGITLDGEDTFLKPSLRACMGISRLHNNPYETANRIMQMDFDVIVKVAAYGLNVAPNKILEEKIYRTGIVNIRPALIAFIHIVNNGGRPVSVDEEGNPKESETESGNAPDPSLSL